MEDLPSVRIATIAAAASVSDTLDLAGQTLVGLVMPAAWDAANITVQASSDGVTFQNVHKADGSELLITAAAARFIVVEPAGVSGLRYIRLRSGTAATPVNQLAARAIGLVLRSI